MTWNINDPQGNEAGKIKWEIVPYTRGRGLDIGCGNAKPFQHFIGLDNLEDNRLYGHNIRPDIPIINGNNLFFFSNESMDFVFSSHLLEHFNYEEVPKVLSEWFRLVKISGYLVLYLPDEDEYPKVGEHGANPDHKWNVNYDRVISAMDLINNWDLVDFQKRNQGNEYSLFFVFQKIGNETSIQINKHNFSYLEKPNIKTCAVVRYGAYGDLMQSSSVIAALKEQGFHITLYTAPPGCDVIRHDPNIDRFIIQDKDQVPNLELGAFWDYISKKYNKFVNLSETIEGTLLALPGRTLHSFPPELREKVTGFNYLEFQHRTARVPYSKPLIKFYPTKEEDKLAQEFRDSLPDRSIVWSLAGSSVHKTWPYMDSVISAILLDFPYSTVILVGGPETKILQGGWEEEPRVVKAAGEWDIRRVFSFLPYANLIIGPETGVLNASSMLNVPKIIFLSHSSILNLTRDWINTVSFYSDKTECPGRGNNQSIACHMLHYGWTYCKRGPNAGVAQCQEDITPEEVYKAIWSIFNSAESKSILRISRDK